MLSDTPPELAAGGNSRSAFLRATLGSAAALAAVVAQPKEAPAFGEQGVCVVLGGHPILSEDGGIMHNATRHAD